MIRISIGFFYNLGGSVRQLGSITAGSKVLSVWSLLFSAKTDIESLFGADWFFPAIKAAYAPGKKLLDEIKVITDRTDFDGEITPMEAFAITTAYNDFETVIKNELVVTDSYFVSRKAGYDTTALIANGEQCFPKDLGPKVPLAIPDVREAGKCLAFELSTAAGLHAMRALETVLGAYWTAVSGGKAQPRPRTIGNYLKQMDKHSLGNAKAKAALRQIKDLHRNPLMHPRESLSLDDAVQLFGIVQSAVGAMLKDIPLVQVKAVSSPAQ